MKTQPASLKQSTIIDPARQTLLVTSLVTAVLAPLPSKLTREIPFVRVEAVYVDVMEDSRMEPDEDQGDSGNGQHLQIKRRWIVGVKLKDGETVSLYEEVTEQAAGDASDIGPRTSYYQALAKRVSEQLGKPLLPMAPAPSAPRTFIEAIDDILQRRLEHGPLHGQSIHVGAKGFGVQISVDGRAYGTMDEIEDAAARDAVRAAIDEWQANIP